MQVANFFTSTLQFVPGFQRNYLQEHLISPEKKLLHIVAAQYLALQSLIRLVFVAMPMALVAWQA